MSTLRNKKLLVGTGAILVMGALVIDVAAYEYELLGIKALSASMELPVVAGAQVVEEVVATTPRELVEPEPSVTPVPTLLSENTNPGVESQPINRHATSFANGVARYTDEKASPTPIPKPIQKLSTLSKPVPSPSTGSGPSAKQPSCSTGTFEQKFLCLLNDYRKSKGKGTLSINSKLTAVATKHSEWMNATGTFSHTDGDGKRFFDRCSDAGVQCTAENLAQGFSSPAQLLKMWQDSSGHNENLLRNVFTMGLGVSGGYATLLLN